MLRCYVRGTIGSNALASGAGMIRKPLLNLLGCNPSVVKACYLYEPVHNFRGFDIQSGCD